MDVKIINLYMVSWQMRSRAFVRDESHAIGSKMRMYSGCRYRKYKVNVRGLLKRVFELKALLRRALVVTNPTSDKSITCCQHGERK